MVEVVKVSSREEDDTMSWELEDPLLSRGELMAEAWVCWAILLTKVSLFAD